MTLTELIVAARELGLLALLLAGAWWLGRHLPKTAAWLVQTWIAEREKDRENHQEIQRQMDARAEKFIVEVTRMCRYRPPEGM